MSGAATYDVARLAYLLRDTVDTEAERHDRLTDLSAICGHINRIQSARREIARGA